MTRLFVAAALAMSVFTAACAPKDDAAKPAAPADKAAPAAPASQPAAPAAPAAPAK